MIYLIGIGPGDKEFITLKALKIIKKADVLIGSKRALSIFEHNNKVILGKNIKDDLKNAIERYKNKEIAILSTGDPCFSGLLKTLKSIGINNITIIPGISSIQIAAAKLKISWEDYHILTLHGKPKNRDKLLKYLKNNENVIFLPNNLKDDIKYLISNGVNEELEIYILENLTYENERIRKMKLKDILNDEFSYLTVCVYKGEDD
ncbi:cobalt-precorrin-6Y C(5)-methyltransferase [Methanocaldococcus villosus KIN24-T80]|uniref:Cobalt-precorrin-6Y C(5)-methyltransferase n=1 Tax=Methanocaldococcus villosus KIN24-T80 TaxID=1069083 RepID=N6VR44_9EURY|nr:cobalt-precorrin-7 (C(5))-methyltransferase [Methanocaldococcus villosus]ENN96380.1 cobalt-precorrin-6Y C(5)-methyltransferase [Methanocaldococcus villosus KIN24-T80]